VLQILSTLAALCGALVVAPFKYMWWFASAGLAILVIAQLLATLEGANENRKNLTYITIACTFIYPLVWLLGSEGTAALGLSQEVGLVAVTELAGKLGFGLYLLFNFEAASGESEDGEALNQQSQQYV
jgi:bacteriorhodopsin